MSEYNSPPRNWQLFAEFCRAEMATGGPDPQMDLITHLSRNQNPIERVWLAGCYGAHHCVPSAYAIWRDIRPEDAALEILTPYLEDHWQALPVRPEMRSHRMIEKRAECLRDFALYAINQTEALTTHTYQEVWVGSISQIKYYNRYMAIKYLEMLRRSVAPALILKSLCPRGAWSPRRALFYLWSDELLENEQDNRPDILEIVEGFTRRTQDVLSDLGITVSFFQLQVMLCEFREAMDGTYYPGASQDEEQNYITIAERDYDLSQLYEARRQIFPHIFLGEISGWEGVRKDKYVNFAGRPQ